MLLIPFTQSKSVASVIELLISPKSLSSTPFNDHSFRKLVKFRNELTDGDILYVASNRGIY